MGLPAIAAAMAMNVHLATAEEPKVFDLALRDGRVAATLDTLRVAKGDRVELRWKSDRPIEVHLHGYDLQAK